MAKKMLVAFTLASLILLAFGLLTSNYWFSGRQGIQGNSVNLGDLAADVYAFNIGWVNAEPGASTTTEFAVNNAGIVILKFKVTPLLNEGDEFLYKNTWVKVWDAKTGQVEYEGWLKDMVFDYQNLKSGQQAKFLVALKLDGASIDSSYELGNVAFSFVVNSTQQINPHVDY